MDSNVTQDNLNPSVYDLTDGGSLVELYIEGVLLSIISILAIGGNTCIWIIICRSKELRTVTNFFILGLTTADWLVSVCNMPVTVITLFGGGTWPLSSDACVLFGFINMLTLVTSVLSLCNISINRYVMVCKPIYFRKIYTRRNTALMITACVTLSVTISLPPLFGWSTYDFIRVQSFCFCDWTVEPSYAFFMIICCFGVPFCVMTICNILIFRTVRASKRKLVPQAPKSSNNPNSCQTIPEKSSEENIESTKQTSSENFLKVPNGLAVEKISAYDDTSTISSNEKAQLSKSKTIEPSDISASSSTPSVGVTVDKMSTSELITVYLPADESKSNYEKTSNSNCKYNVSMTTASGKTIKKHKIFRIHRKSKHGKARADEIRLATALAVVVVTFFCCWFPYCISMVLSMFGPAGVPRGLHMTTLLVGYLNSACNPIIYGVMNKKFGDGFKRLLCSCRK
ncbi:beta-3 adrenergic receptor-like [Mizuhopecten yessoensis]|uniref:D(2) dopamine receptor A n=1 Tax=Mizuhopecten yessoensis TaxID=6573 RepID=A0A210Q5Q3_MIZYE|nr:beta-3 adrenergic receptor-like [Mizuhopecten yessoensis]OWF44070.1 D(2) dopamine receptor A [Mizuhopecten yessoensis]